MKYILVDDEPLALKDMEETILEVDPGCSPACFGRPREAMDYARDHKIDVAFLDIEMGSLSGITLAKVLKEIQPEISIIFVTSHVQYAVEAFSIHASGYLLKPVAKEDMMRELTFLYGDVNSGPGKRVVVKTFGGFEVLVDDIPLNFKRAKSKELLAILIDKKGVSVTTREACALLWEDQPYGSAQKSYFQTVVAELKQTLRQAGIEDFMVKKWNSLSIRPEMADCDSYRFMEGDAAAVNSYRHDYMSCYSWAEFSIGKMERELI
ncbi:MAG: response regulator [Lachnospiraceae bacterium]